MNLDGIRHLLQSFGAKTLHPGIYGLRRAVWPPIVRTLELYEREMAAGVSTQALLDGPLGPGAWQLYLGAHAVAGDALPDLFHGELGDAVAFAAAERVPLLIDAWHDNSEWRVLLEPSVVPGLAAKSA